MRGDYAMKKANGEDDFFIDEVVTLKGFLFKVVLIDAFTGKLGLKQISPKEAEILKETQKQERTPQETAAAVRQLEQ
ncbi:MAG: hypothetical protein A2Z83_03850 [Omnitrophica bacterium GWA2_52_8]|nr:MAG: hypothetical protein A2Z83_03850 [Omnitrophica bacterium GWA2_52_8]